MFGEQCYNLLMSDYIDNIPKAVNELQQIFDQNIDKRICVVGSSCVGKSTLINYLPNAVDMDDLLSGSISKGIGPLLTKEEIEYVTGPWDEDVGNFMINKAKSLITINKGQPVFGTIVFPSDLIIEIDVPDSVLIERIKDRNSVLNDVLNMRNQIKDEIGKSDIERITIYNI